jgi:hypothetical protein
LRAEGSEVVQVAEATAGGAMEAAARVAEPWVQEAEETAAAGLVEVIRAVAQEVAARVRAASMAAGGTEVGGTVAAKVVAGVLAAGAAAEEEMTAGAEVERECPQASWVDLGVEAESVGEVWGVGVEVVAAMETAAKEVAVAVEAEMVEVEMVMVGLVATMVEVVSGAGVVEEDQAAVRVVEAKGGAREEAESVEGQVVPAASEGVETVLESGLRRLLVQSSL